MRVKKIVFIISIIMACILLYSVNTYAVDEGELYIKGDNTVKVGKTIELEAYIKAMYVNHPEGTKDPNVTDEVLWKSSNTNIATVEKGIVTGIAEGTVTITAEELEEGITPQKASFEVTVTKPDPYSKPVYYLEVSGESLLLAGETIQLKAKAWEQEGIFEVGKREPIEIKPEKKNETDVTNKVIWTSSDAEIATVDNKGLVKGIKGGKVTIIAKQTINDLTLEAKQQIDVAPKSENPPVDQGQSKLEVRTGNNAGNTVNQDGTLQLKAIRINAEAGVNMEEDVTNGAIWTSSNPEVATVDNKGLVKGLKAGKAIITAKYSINGVEKEAKYEITVQGSSGNSNPQKPVTSGDGTTSKDPIPKTGLYGNLILAIAVVIPIISFAIYKKYEKIG